MNRRKFLLSSTVAAAASASLPALASTTERFSTKQRPVDTMNRIEGWTQGKVKPVKVRNLMIREGRSKIYASTTDENEADMLKTAGAAKMLVHQLQQALQHNALFFEHAFC